MATGLVVYEEQVLPLDISIEFTSGHGEVFVDGPVDSNIEASFGRALEFAHNLADLEEFTIPDFSGLDTHLRFRFAIPDVPIIGDSYGLALAVAFACECANLDLNPKLAITGAVDHLGDVLPVGDIERKRYEASRLGFGYIMLPAGQLDFFNKDIGQIPVKNLFEAWTSLVYDEAT